GDLDAARNKAEFLLQKGETKGFPYLAGLGHWGKALISLALARAEPALDEATAALCVQALKPARSLVLSTVATAELALGRNAAAPAPAREAAALLEKHGAYPFSSLAIPRVLAEALRATGDEAAARSAIAAARATLEAQATTLGEASLRASFLE